MRLKLLTAACVLACTGLQAAEERVPSDLAAAIDPFIGSVTFFAGGRRGADSPHGFGKTFPGAATPFGQVQLSPDTITGGDNGPGYSYTHKTIEGFSFLHMSGIGWYGDFGNLQVMPTTGPLVPDREKACSPFDHVRETARAGYYRVHLGRYNVTAELTATPHTGFLRFTYPSNTPARVQIDLARRIGQTARYLTVSKQNVTAQGDRVLTGEMVCSSADGGWGHGHGGVNYTVYFYLAFSRPFKEVGVWDGTNAAPHIARAGAGHNLGVWATFGPLAEPLVIKGGISFDSLADARANYVREAAGLTFDAARQAAYTLWQQALAGITIHGGTVDERIIFATALYHAFLDPREIGRGTLKGHPFVRRTVFSGWDVFRSAFPLLTLVRPDVVSDTVNSMMETVVTGKRTTLPRWDIFGCPGGCMVGQPIISVMADAWEKGIRTFDGPCALRLACQSLEREGNNRVRGYSAGSLSRTLEYAYTDWCCSRLADALGQKDVAARYAAYAHSWTNCWSREVGWLRARQADGTWMPWEGLEKEGQGCVESNPWQQGWFVPHEPDVLIALMGGRERFTAELERFFARAPKNFLWNPGYNHPNEPCHTLPYLWAFSTRPGDVGVWTRRICAGAYGTGPFGLCGNEDVGQMSAWYVLSAIGLHPLCPGDGKWYVTAPLFEETCLRLDPRYYSGGTFTIRAPHARERNRSRVGALHLNGRLVQRPYLTTAEVTAGGLLVVDLY